MFQALNKLIPKHQSPILEVFFEILQMAFKSN